MRTCTQSHAHVDLLLVVEHLPELDDVGVMQLLQHVNLFGDVWEVVHEQH